MPCEDIVGSRLAALRKIIRDDFDESPAQVQGFVARVLDRKDRYDPNEALYQQRTVEDCLEAVRFEGYPALARAGYNLACSSHAMIHTELTVKFMQGIEQQCGRPRQRQAELAGDALALLGIADGLHAVEKKGQSNAQRLETAKAWMQDLLEKHGGSDARLSRVRLLASDLLNDRGCFGRHLAQSDDVRVAALDLCLWQSWSDVLRNVEYPDTEQRRELLTTLLTTQPPGKGELLHASIWLCAFNVLIGEIATTAVQDEHQIARILTGTQGSFRRWRWERDATRRKTMPARWLIDKEADVQAFLLAVLHPYFGDRLEDEQYLQGFGLRQSRFDFAITNLGLIVEVKVMRTSSDTNKIENEIADDLALYFKDGNPFRTMIVYIYDDRDNPEPEKYSVIRDALKRRSDRILDVIIVQRPSMIPDRDDRD